MEIELSWPSWLPKVVLIIFSTLIFLSLNRITFVSSMLLTDSRYITNTSILSTVAVATVPTDHHILGHEDELNENNKNNKYLITEAPDSQLNDALTLDYISKAKEYQYDDEYTLQKDYEEAANSEDWFGVSVLSMIMAREEDTEESSIIFNETFWSSLDCEDFWKLPPPPNFAMFIPPPPIPPFLREQEITFREAKMNFKESENKIEDTQNEIIFDDQFCSLCSWANEAINLTAIAVVNAPKKDTKAGIGPLMTGILVGVAFLSAVIGAAFMGVFLKCRKREASSVERASCPLVLRRRWLNSSFRKNRSGQSASGNNVSDNVDLDGRGGTNDLQINAISLGITRSASTFPLQMTSPDSENSGQSEDHYISAETTSSVVYAELSSNNQNHHYSEIEEIYHLPNLVNFRDETYEKFGYFLPEISSIRVADGSMYSSNISAPSSAYYSDISSGDIYVTNSNTNNSRSKRKRKRNLKFTPNVVASFGGSCNACSQPNYQCQNYSSKEKSQNFPKSFDSQIINITQNIQEVPLQNQTTIESTFPIHNNPEGIFRVHLNAFGGSPSFSSIPSPNNKDNSLWHVYELQSLKAFNPEARRSLPPLPRSRMPNSYRKHLRGSHPHGISSVPSEYI